MGSAETTLNGGSADPDACLHRSCPDVNLTFNNILIGLSEWPSWQRRKSCGNSRTFAWVRVQLQTGARVITALFSDNTQTPHLNLRNRRYPSVFG